MSRIPTNNIHQIYPAPGFRVFACCVLDDGTDFYEVPVIGWAVLRPILNPEDCSPTSEHVGETDDTIELYVYDTELEATSITSLSCSNVLHFIVAPGQEVTDELKADWEERTRAHVAHEEARDRLRRRICDLADQKVTQEEIVEQTGATKWQVAEDIRWHREMLAIQQRQRAKQLA